MSVKVIVLLVAVTGTSMAAVPSDPLEVVMGQPQAVASPASQMSLVRLLGRARASYDLRSERRGYDLNVTFTVDSGGQTDYDGTWKMEDIFDPRQGLRWTATAGSGYTVTRISSGEVTYGEGTATTIPLRLHEARAALLGALPSQESLKGDAVRTFTATFRGEPLTCILLSRPGAGAAAAAGRSWDEAEECLDTKTGLLAISSQVPGRYFAYDYTDSPRLGARMLPSKVTITEGGKTVSTISVDSLKEMPSSGAELFVPTAEMKARGGALVGMAGAQKISRVYGQGPFTPDMTAKPVCVFGLVTPSGQLVEAHSLQPDDPNSKAAVEDAKRINFAPQTAAGAKAQQHFVFVIEKFY